MQRLVTVSEREDANMVMIIADAFWAVWVAMLVIGDPIFNWVFGEQYSLTHFLVSRVTTSLRVPIIAWVAWHFIVAHKSS